MRRRARFLAAYHVFAAEPAVDGYDVPATLNGEPAMFAISLQRGRYRIEDVVAAPAAFDAAQIARAIAQ